MTLLSEGSGKRYSFTLSIKETNQIQNLLYFFSKLLQFIFIPIIFFSNVTAQIISDPGAKPVNDIIESIEMIYGADDVLVSGKIYYQEFPLAEGHPFFLSDEWIDGIIFIKGKRFDGIEIKYDLDMDRIVLNTRNRKGAFVDLILNHPMIDSLYIKNHLFINESLLKIEKESSNFFEVVFKGEPMMIINHKKEFLDDYSERHPYGRYRDPSHKIFLYGNETLTEVTSKSAFLNYYKLHKKEIKRYLKQNRINYKKANNKQLFGIMVHCISLENSR